MLDTDKIMNSVLNAVVPRIKESEFRTKYLPLVFSDQQGAFELAWLHQVVGNPHQEVRVVLDSNEEHVLFIVPPLREHVTAKVPKRLGEILSYIDVQSNAALHPEVFIETNTVEVIPISMPVPEGNDAKWREIFKFYKLLPPDDSVEVANSNDGVQLSEAFDDDE